MRCFVAIELSDDVKRPLLRLLDERLPRGRGVRWCSPQQLHLTLKFLGEVEQSQLTGVRRALDAASAQLPPFELTLATLGVFPQPERPRVFWVGVDDPAEGCGRWLAAADPLFAELGFASEQRAFTPHITLGRSKSPEGGKLMRSLLSSLPKPGSPTMTADHVVLFESRLRPSGAEYRPVHSAALRGG